MSEQLGEAVLVLRTDDKGLDSGIAQAKGKSEQLGKTLDATSGSATRLGGALSGAGRDAAGASQGLQRNAQAAMQLHNAQQRVGASAAQQRFAFMDLGRQIGDVSTMYALGARPMQIFASQSGQMFQAIQMISGGTSRFAMFMSGPWGVAMQIAVLALLPLIGNLLESGSAAEKAADAMRKKAREDMASREALVIYGETVEGHIEKERKLREELDKQIQSQRQLNQLRAKEAEKTLQNLQDDLANKQKELTAAEQRLRSIEGDIARPPAFSTPEGIMGLAVAAQLAKKKVTELKKDVSDLRASVRSGEETARLADIPRMQESVEAKLDPAKGKIIELNDAIDRLNDAFKKGEIGPAEYGRKFGDLTQQLDKVKAAAKETTKAIGETTKFVMPVDGRSTGRFGEQRDKRTHAGIDIAVPVGTPVKAPAGGTVIEAGTLPGYGNVVFIDHGGGTISRLAHLSRLDVTKGQAIRQGEMVGLSGGAKGAPGAGNSQGPHVHYEVRQGGKPVDPRTGAFRTDALGAEQKSEEARARAAEKAEREREQEVRRQAQFDQASAALDDRLLDLKQRGLVDEEAQAQIERDRVNLAEARFTSDLAAQVSSGQLLQAEADILAAKHKLLTAAQLELIDAEERARKLDAGLETELRLSDLRIELLRAQEGLARTTEQRRDIALAILAEEERQLRITYEQTLAKFKLKQATQEQVDRAKAALDQAVALNPYRTEAIRRDNAGPLDRYLEETNPEKTRDRVEGYVVDELEALHKGITDAVADRLGIEDPFLRSLISMFIEQVLIRPIAQALQGAQGGGGGIGGLFGSLFSLFGGGGASIAALSADAGAVMDSAQFAGLFDKGGMIPNGSYGIVHEGEKAFPTRNGVRIEPNANRRPGGGGMQVAFHNDFRGADAAAVAGIQGRLDRMEAELPGQIVSTMQDARARFVWRS